jgi:hypothetical protein
LPAASDTGNTRITQTIMVTTKIGKHKVELYDSVPDMPLLRFFKYNRFMLIDSGVGSDLADVDNHISRAVKFLGKDPKAAAQELENLQVAIYLIMQEMGPKYMAYASLIKSVDGVDLYDLSDESVKKILTMLGDVPVGIIDRAIAALKKKYKSN